MKSLPRPTRHAGTARSSASSRRWSASGRTPTPGPTPPNAPGPAILPPLLQPASPTRLTGRPAADQPRSQRPWAGQL